MNKKKVEYSCPMCLEGQVVEIPEGEKEPLTIKGECSCGWKGDLLSENAPSTMLCNYH